VPGDVPQSQLAAPRPRADGCRRGAAADGCARVANCEFVASQWRRFVRTEWISVVLNGVAGPGKVRRSDRTLRIGCIGRIGPEKGQREFVRAAARIHEALPDAVSCLRGGALRSEDAHRYAVEVRRAAAGLPMEFRGWVGDITRLAELDLLLCPRTGRRPRRVIPEAFAAGVPAIAFDTGAFRRSSRMALPGAGAGCGRDGAGGVALLSVIGSGAIRWRGRHERRGSSDLQRKSFRSRFWNL